jgi:hypothetical protein
MSRYQGSGHTVHHRCGINVAQAIADLAHGPRPLLAAKVGAIVQRGRELGVNRVTLALDYDDAVDVCNWLVKAGHELARDELVQSMNRVLADIYVPDAEHDLHLSEIRQVQGREKLHVLPFLGDVA